MSESLDVARYACVFGHALSGKHSAHLTSYFANVVLAQKEYNKRFLKIARAELNRLERDIRIFTEENADLIYQNLSEKRKELIKPYICTDELYVIEWLKKEFTANPYMHENRIYETDKGDKVRSKSEAILADMLYNMGIPYHYEKPLRLKNGRIIYPDFTLLHVKSRTEFYLEHFGLLDDEDYFKNTIHKIDEYRNNGIYPGKNLIFTYETSYSPFDIKGTKKMITELLNPEGQSIKIK